MANKNAESPASKDEKLNKALHEIFEDLGLELPWDGDFDEFMSDPKNTLDFDKT